MRWCHRRRWHTHSLTQLHCLGSNDNGAQSLPDKTHNCQIRLIIRANKGWSRDGRSLALLVYFLFVYVFSTLYDDFDNCDDDVHGRSSICFADEHNQNRPLSIIDYLHSPARSLHHSKRHSDNQTQSIPHKLNRSHFQAIKLNCLSIGLLVVSSSHQQLKLFCKNGLIKKGFQSLNNLYDA